MHYKLVILAITITLFVEDLKSSKVWGKFTNISEIMQRIIDDEYGLLKVEEPDLTWCDVLGDSVILVVKKKKTNPIDANEEYKDSDIITKSNESSNSKINKKQHLRKTEEKRKEKPSLVKIQHDRKVDEITEFLENNYLTTNYLYDELKRIKRQRKVKDDLRRMVEYVEKPDKFKMKADLLKCYIELRKTELFSGKDLYNHKTNNLAINILKDPYNDGFIN